MSNPDSIQDTVHTAHVFARVAARLESDDAARSLWLKLQQEIDTGGVPSAMSYFCTF
jgi:hypothetical protein